MTPPPLLQQGSHMLENLDPLHMCEAQLTCPTDRVNLTEVFNTCDVAAERSEADILPPKIVQGRCRRPLGPIDQLNANVPVDSTGEIIDCWSGSSRPSKPHARPEFFVISSPAKAHNVTWDCFGGEKWDYDEGMNHQEYRLDYDDTPIGSSMRTPMTRKGHRICGHQNTDVVDLRNDRYHSNLGYDTKSRSCEPCSLSSLSLQDCFDVGPRKQEATTGDWWFTPTKQPYKKEEGYDL